MRSSEIGERVCDKSEASLATATTTKLSKLSFQMTEAIAKLKRLQAAAEMEEARAKSAEEAADAAIKNNKGLQSDEDHGDPREVEKANARRHR